MRSSQQTCSYNSSMQRRAYFTFTGLILLTLFALAGQRAHAQAFDLSGPKVDIHVQRNGKTLPIAEVASLLPGDRLWIHPDFPDSQSARYVLIVTFLRGSTNPPPPEWFTRVDTWTRAVHDEGVFVVVPAEAQQALFFLAPETGGDFSTLRQAVRGRPGAFVRATQDLQQASWDRMRLDDYLSGVKDAAIAHPLELKERTALLARSLGIKVDRECFDKPSEQQAPCLVQHTDGLVLDDANAQSLAHQLTSGSTVDLMNHLSYSTLAGGGNFSPYVGAIIDVARILSSVHVAHFQYLPALALPEKDTMNLRLNVPPSFRDPKSVLVVALPPVGPLKAPALLPAVTAATYCAQKPDLVLEADSAPILFATTLAHDLKLHIDTANGPLDIPVHTDPALGGIVLDHAPPLMKPTELTGILRGKWGFDDWEGPHFHLHSAQPLQWKLGADDQSALVLDRDDTLPLEAFNDEKRVTSTFCVNSVELIDDHGEERKLVWKTTKSESDKLEAAKSERHKSDVERLEAAIPDSLEVVVPMKLKEKSESVVEQPPFVTLAIHQYGLEKPDRIILKTYAEAAALDRLTLDAYDSVALLKGKRLDEVASLQLEGTTFTPSALNRIQDTDQLVLHTTGATDSLVAGRHYNAHVQLHDGRTLKVPVTVGPPRPQLHLRTKGVQFDSNEPSPLHLGSDDDLPVNGRLVFFLDSKFPVNFPRTEKVEVAATDGSFHTELSLADGSLMLEDAHTALASLDPITRFGSSAFGPIQIRALAAEGTTGDWIPLGTLVRLPGFKALRCPRSATKPCLLSGSNLFLLDSIASTAEFQNPVQIPMDFTGIEISVPRPTNGLLYLRLRDDPATLHTLTLPIEFLPAAQITTATPTTDPAKLQSTTSTVTPDDASPKPIDEQLLPTDNNPPKAPQLPNNF